MLISALKTASSLSSSRPRLRFLRSDSQRRCRRPSPSVTSVASNWEPPEKHGWDIDQDHGEAFSALFPTCQVRVVRFYQSECPPAASSSSSSTSCPPRPPPSLRLFHLHFRLANLANSSPSASPTSQLSAHCWTSTCELPSSVCTAGPQPASCPAQCAPLDLNLRVAQLSVHRWTSTGDLPSSVCTAGPQPGTFPAQCAPLDLNLGPAQLSVHRWTSTWDLPSSVCTAGPQRPDRMPEDMPDGMSHRMPEDMPDNMPDRMPDRMPEDTSENMPEDMPGRMPEDMPDKMPEDMPDRMPEDMPDRMPDKMSDRMPEKIASNKIYKCHGGDHTK